MNQKFKFQAIFIALINVVKMINEYIFTVNFV